VGEQAGGVLAGDVTGANDGGAKFGHGIGRRREGEKERRRGGVDRSVAGPADFRNMGGTPMPLSNSEKKIGRR